MKISTIAQAIDDTEGVVYELLEHYHLIEDQNWNSTKQPKWVPSEVGKFFCDYNEWDQMNIATLEWHADKLFKLRQFSDDDVEVVS